MHCGGENDRFFRAIWKHAFNNGIMDSGILLLINITKQEKAKKAPNSPVNKIFFIIKLYYFLKIVKTMPFMHFLCRNSTYAILLGKFLSILYRCHYIILPIVYIISTAFFNQKMRTLK